METHHDFFEWASQFGLDLKKVEATFPALTDRKKLAEWVDSPSNMLVLCEAHHRAKYEGIHEITYPAWLLQRYQGEEWVFIEQHQAPKPKIKLLALGDSFPRGPIAT